MATDETTEEFRGHPEDSDGIEEFDNQLPRWWVGLFIATIIWGVWIMLDWHVFNQRSLTAQYETRAASFVVPEPPDLEGTVALIAAGDVNLEAGGASYQQYCAVCHAADATGDVGPDLTDSEWLYDHHVEGIVESIAMGRPNGMQAWYNTLGQERVAEVAAWVAALTDAPLQNGGDQAAAEDVAGTADTAEVDDAPTPATQDGLLPGDSDLVDPSSGDEPSPVE